MQRVTLTLDDELMDEIDALMERRGYQNRSEAVRDLARAGLAQATHDLAGHDSEAQAPDCLATLAYVYDYKIRDLSERLTRRFHEHHNLSLATLRVPLDHDTSMEVAVLRGSTSEVSAIAEKIIAERGVRHGRLMIVPVRAEQQTHAHGHGPDRDHLHLRPR